MIPDFQKDVLILTLGGIALYVTDYQVKTEVPVQRTLLCDGSSEIRLLPAVPCILKVSGTVPQNECGTYLTALQTALRTHQSFDTEFAGMQFTGLQLTEITGTEKQHDKIAVLSLSLIGGMEA